MKKIFMLMTLVMSFFLYACSDDKDEPKNFEEEPFCELKNIDPNNFTAYKTLPRALSQAMAVYNDYILLFSYDTNRAIVYLYKLSDGTLLATLLLPNNTYKRPHCNAVSFSNVYNKANSILPLLYVSQWDDDSEKGCFVYDITLSNGNYRVDLVQTILPTNVTTTIRGAGQTDWIVDPLGYIYSVGYLVENGATITTNNKTMVTKYKLPAINKGSEVMLSNVDVLDNFELPIFIYRQDMCFEDGNILMLVGMTNNTAPRRLVFINPDTHCISLLLSLDFINEEPEGIGVKDGMLLIGFYGDQVVYQLKLV